MKPGQNAKQRSRGRNIGGGNKGGGRMPPRNTTFDSSGPEIRVRGNAHQVLEKYLGLARDASAQGDRISAENYYQHAEHYFRVINSQNQHNGQRGNPGQRQMSTPADDQNPIPGDLDGEEDEIASADTEIEAEADAEEGDETQKEALRA